MNNRKALREGRNGWILAAFLIVLASALMAGCGKGGSGRDGGDGVRDERLSVVTTIFPYYDFVRQVAGDRVKVKLIVPAGMNSHSFEPTPADMIAIEEADVLICNGGEMEQWVSRVLESLDTRHMKVLTMMDYVDVAEEEHVEGMEDGNPEHMTTGDPETGHIHEGGHAADEAHIHEPGHDHQAHGHEGGEHQASFDRKDGHEMEIEYDEHIWTSPVKAQAIVEIISQALMEASPGNKAHFQAGRDAYLKELKLLDDKLRQVVSQGRHRMIVVADKFPFRYFADEYGLSYRAAFSGCSTDTEPSAKTIAYLIDQVKEEEIGAVYYLELSSRRTAEIICEETGAVPLLLHSCHNVTRKQFDEGITYLQLMLGNGENLRKGLE